jgi:hypothetical protein
MSLAITMVTPCMLVPKADAIISTMAGKRNMLTTASARIALRSRKRANETSPACFLDYLDAIDFFPIDRLCSINSEPQLPKSNRFRSVDSLPEIRPASIVQNFHLPE